MMKIDSSLKEVWDWKDQIYEETKTMSMEERVHKIQRDVDTILLINRLELRIVEKRSTKAAYT